MKDFIFESTPKIVFGAGSIAYLVRELNILKKKSAFFICDPVIEKTIFFNDLSGKLKKEGFIVNIFSEIVPDPDFDSCDMARDAIVAAGSDIVIGIGGGSAMDIAKVAAITAKNRKKAKDLVKNPELCEPGMPLVLIPTTAGTGSEVTHIGIFSDNDEKLKTGIVSPYLYADVAILDPEITVSMPETVTAHSGTDAIIHALEALTSKLATPFTDLLAEEALGILYRNILPAFEDGNNIEARSNMLYGSMLAGKAFANSSVAAIHAFAYPIGAEFHIPHGLANSIMLIPVLKFNLNSDIEKYCRAARAIGVQTTGLSEAEILNRLLFKLEFLLDRLKIKRSLGYYGVTESDIPRLALSVMKVTRLLSNNPGEVLLEDAERLYREAM